MSLGVEGQSYLRALAHPLRLQLLSLLTGAPMSAAEVARELDLAHAAASYHLRQLLAAGLVEVVEERSNRGGRERRYKPTPSRSRPEAETVEARTLLTAALAEELRRRAAAIEPAAPSTFADAELWVSPEVLVDVRDRVHAAMQLLHEAARPPREDGTRRVGATVALFGMHS
jgi:DNA-binding transcriptional ArsR family regulator